MTVAFDDPRPSIFSDVRICLPDADGSRRWSDTGHSLCKASRKDAIAAIRSNLPTPSEILTFQLVNNGKELGTVSSFLTSQSWYNTAMTDFAKKSPAPTGDDVRNFCNTLTNTMTALGLNTFDADLVLGAVRIGMAVPASAGALMATHCAAGKDA